MSPPLTHDVPKVLFWYRLYAVGMFALYALLTIGMISALVFMPREALQQADPDLPPIIYTIYFIAISAVSLVMAAVFGVSFFLKTKPWTWVYHLVLICLGFGSPCCLPASVPLLIFWIRDDTRNYFGRR